MSVAGVGLDGGERLIEERKNSPAWATVGYSPGGGREAGPGGGG